MTKDMKDFVLKGLELDLETYQDDDYFLAKFLPDEVFAHDKKEDTKYVIKLGEDTELDYSFEFDDKMNPEKVGFTIVKKF